MDFLTMADAGANFSAEQVAAIILAIVGLLGGGGFVGKKISDAKKMRTTIDGQPVGVELSERPATFRELEDLKEDIERRIDSLARDVKSLAAEAKRDTEGVHARVDKAVIDLNQVVGEMKQVTSQLNLILQNNLKRPGAR